MKTTTVERFCYSPFGVFGHIVLPSGIVLASVERPWLDNRVMVSCIPDGEYECAPRRFYRGGYDAVEILNVPSRTHILFHVANYVHELNGCIGVNTYHGAKGNEWCGWKSRDAFSQLMGEIGSEKSKLVIKSVTGATLSATAQEKPNE